MHTSVFHETAKGTVGVLHQIVAASTFCQVRTRQESTVSKKVQVTITVYEQFFYLLRCVCVRLLFSVPDVLGLLALIFVCVRARIGRLFRLVRFQKLHGVHRRRMSHTEAVIICQILPSLDDGLCWIRKCPVLNTRTFTCLFSQFVL